jgi:leucine-rich repeat protein SHOC2
MDRYQIERLIHDTALAHESHLSLRDRGIRWLPESFGNLTNITTLDISKCNLERLPQTFGNLVNLAELNLSENRLTGLPSSFSQLTNLTHLDLSGNNLTVLPLNLSCLTQLTSLRLNGTHLINVVNNWGALSQLTHLDLSFNRLLSIPDNIGELTALTDLDLAYTSLRQLPESIGNLIHLKDLNIDGNELESLPETIGNLCNLERLNLYHNRFLTSLPKSFANLTNLNSLAIDSKHLNAVLSIAERLKNLEYISFSGAFSGDRISDLLKPANEPWPDLSVLAKIPNLQKVSIGRLESPDVGGSLKLPRRYWCKLDDWQAEWLLDETSIEIHQLLIEHLGYKKISEQLPSVVLDTWQNYTLLEIPDVILYYIVGRRVYRTSLTLLKITNSLSDDVRVLRVGMSCPEVEDVVFVQNEEYKLKKPS